MNSLINSLYYSNLDLAVFFVIIFAVCEIGIIVYSLKPQNRPRWFPLLFVVGFISIFLSMPFILNEAAYYKLFKKPNKIQAIELEKRAIEFSYIPVQKGINYIRLSRYYKMNRNGTEAMRALNEAHTYFKGYYNHNVWQETFYEWYAFGQFDTVIEILENSNVYSIVLPEAYILLGKDEIAYDYLINAQMFGYGESAILGYILKSRGEEDKASEYYNKALELTYNDKQKTEVEGYYNDAVNYIKTKLNRQRAAINLLPL